MTNELIKSDTVRLTVEKAKEHAKKIENIIIVTDDDFKIANKEKTTAKDKRLTIIIEAIFLFLSITPKK